MGNERYIWSLDQSQKIRIREVREYKVSYDGISDAYFVSAHGYGFGKGITIFGPATSDACTEFVDKMTTEAPKTECGAAVYESKEVKI